MAVVQLLCSEKFIKENSSISDNIGGKYILAALRDAQEIRLKGILGECLLNTLKQMQADGVFREDPIPVDALPYKELVDQCQFFLLHATEVDLLFRVSYKVGNFGVAKSSDENLLVASSGEIERQQVFYQSKADAEAAQIQEFLLQNRSSFPELKACDCARIQANLRTAASCGIVLGGARGKQAPYKKGGCCR